jgi:hypothetical protein
VLSAQRVFLPLSIASDGIGISDHRRVELGPSELCSTLYDNRTSTSAVTIRALHIDIFLFLLERVFEPVKWRMISLSGT